MNIPLLFLMSLVLCSCADTNNTIDNRPLSEKVDFSLHNIDAPVSQIEWLLNSKILGVEIYKMDKKLSLY